MSISHVTKRLAITGVVTALAAGTMVAGTASTANAAPASGIYTCQVPLLGPTDFPVSLDAPGLPTTVPAGLPVPAGLLPVNVVMGAPASVAGLLNTLGVTGGNSPDFAMLLAGSPVPVSGLNVMSIVPQGDGSALLNATGSNGAFTTPVPGVYDLTLPAAFTLQPTGASPLPALPCATKDGADPVSYTTITVVKQTGAISAKAVTKVKKGKKAKVPTTVAGQYGNVPTGKVVAKMGSKTVGTGNLNSVGKTVITMKKMSLGKHKITLKYLGDLMTNPATKQIIVKVIR